MLIDRLAQDVLDKVEMLKADKRSADVNLALWMAKGKILQN